MVRFRLRACLRCEVHVAGTRDGLRALHVWEEAASRDTTPRSPAVGIVTNRFPQLFALPIARDWRRVTHTLKRSQS